MILTRKSHYSAWTAFVQGDSAGGSKLIEQTLLIEPERFKTRAAHFPVQRDGRTGMQRATLGKSGSETAS